MDEKVITAGKDTTGTTRKGAYTRSCMCAQQVGSIFRNCNRMTMMASVCAVGTPGPFMVVLKRTALRTKTMHGNDGEPKALTVTDCLPRYTLITLRQDVAGCDKRFFLSSKHQLLAL